MRRSLLVIFLLLCAFSVGSAQTQTVGVVADGGEALGFSYVFINGKPYGSTTQLGETNIPLSALRKGDTLSASYVGYRSGFVVFEGGRAERYVVPMFQDNMIQAIEIHTRRDSHKEFSRFINDRVSLCATAQFKSSFILEQDGAEVIRGNWLHVFTTDLPQIVRVDDEIRRDIRSKGESDPGKVIEDHTYLRTFIELPEEQAGLTRSKEGSRMLRKEVMPVLKDVFYTASRSVCTNHFYIGESHTEVAYTGKDDIFRNFLLTRQANGKSSDKTLSMTAHVRVDTINNEVVWSNIDVLKKDVTMNIRAQYTNYYEMKYPYMMVAEYRLADGPTYRLAIYDVVPTFDEKYVEVDRKRSIVNWSYDGDILAPSDPKNLIEAKSPLAEELRKEFVEDVKMTILLDEHNPRMNEMLELIALVNSLY